MLLKFKISGQKSSSSVSYFSNILWSDKTKQKQNKTNKKRDFWQQTLKMGLVHTGIKKYTMCKMKYTSGSLMLCAYSSARDPGQLVQIHGIMDSSKYQKINKKIKK